LFNNLGQGFCHSKQPGIDKAAHQGVVACVNQNRKDKEEFCYQDERRLPLQMN
jgi:hypothetical protein